MSHPRRRADSLATATTQSRCHPVREERPRHARSSQSSHYLAHLVRTYEVGIKPLISKAMGVQTLSEDRADETEFVTFPTGGALKRCRVSQVAIRRAATGPPDTPLHRDTEGRAFPCQLSGWQMPRSSRRKRAALLQRMSAFCSADRKSARTIASMPISI